MKYAIILLRYLKGYVKINVIGGFHPRFLNLCSAAGIGLWNVFLQDKALSCCMSCRDFIKLRAVASKSGVRVKIIKKSGLIYKYRKHKKRVGLAIGIFIFLTVHLILSMFVWCLDVKGNTTISESDILAQAESYGLMQGTLKKEFDEIRASRYIATAYDGKVTWMSINIKGSLAVIELRENERITAETEERQPCNIVADFDGVILSAETYCGDCMVKKGTGVRKGDLLINGAIVNEDMSTTFYAAKGKITALHEKEINISSNKKPKISVPKITDTKYRIYLFGLTFPRKTTETDKNSLIYSEKKMLNINGLNLPFGTEKILICEKKSDTASSHLICEYEKIQNSIYKQNANSNVVTKNESVALKNSSLTFNGKYTVIDFLGEEKPILSENQK